jgi:hypothetical protein
MLGSRHPIHADVHANSKSKATGGSAMKAVEVLMEHGVPEERIIFINLVRPYYPRPMTALP